MPKLTTILLTLLLLCYTNTAFAEDFPQWKDIPKKEYLPRAKMALVLNLPYHTKEEEIKLKKENEKIKIEYQKKFGEPITSYELSTIRVNLVTMDDNIIDQTFLSIHRTTSGAIVKYRPKNEQKLFTIELNMDEWLDFVRALYKCRINEWNKKYGERDILKDELNLRIYSLDKNLFDISVFAFSEPSNPSKSSGRRGGRISVPDNTYPPNWKEFKKIIDDMVAKIKR